MTTVTITRPRQTVSGTNFPESITEIDAQRKITIRNYERFERKFQRPVSDEIQREFEFAAPLPYSLLGLKTEIVYRN